MGQFIVSEHVDTKLLWNDVLSVWTSCQVGLPQVTRWSKYYQENGQIRARKQDSLQHSHSIDILGHIFCHKIRGYISLDEILLLKALAIHDHGEGILLFDTHYVDKSEDGDLQEYNAFVSSYHVFSEELFEEFHRAFLLQFALKNPASFPLEARVIMVELARTNKLECLAFNAIERWDYVLYALEQFLFYGNVKILVQVLRHQMSHLDRLAKDLTGFGEQIWTSSVCSWFSEFLARYDGLWIEQKGEK